MRARMLCVDPPGVFAFKLRVFSVFTFREGIQVSKIKIKTFETFPKQKHSHKLTQGRIWESEAKKEAPLKNLQHGGLLERRLDAVLYLASKYGSSHGKDNPKVVLSGCSPVSESLTSNRISETCSSIVSSSEITDIFTDHHLFPHNL